MSKHERVHLLIISETGKVKSRKISIRFIKWFIGIFLFLFLLTSCITYFYLKDFWTHRTAKVLSANLQNEVNRLRSKLEKMQLENDRLQGMVSRLKAQNEDLKKHLLSRKQKKEIPPERKKKEKKLAAFQTLLQNIENLKPSTPESLFHIRDPKITVTGNKTTVSFKLYKDTLKRIYGRYILLGIYKPEEPEKTGEITAYPARCLKNHKLLPGYGRFFKIERLFLTVEATLPHPPDVTRFSEFHVLIFGMKKEPLFHEKFKAP